MEIPASAWIVFASVLGALLAVDLWLHVRNRDSRKAAIVWSIIWVGAGLAFAGYVAIVAGQRTAHEYLAAYLIEKSLSLDNLFVFLVIFSALKVPKEHHHLALSWGIFGALLFRAVFIVVGVEALQRWQWIEYVFAGILLYAAVHALRENPLKKRGSGIVDWLSQHLPVSKQTESKHFFVEENGRRLATPFLVAIIAIETTDIIFAVDSVPAALSVSRQEFVVYSSNAFAILGLRALYVVLEDLMRRLVYLNYGLAAVLGFAAVKMGASHWFEIPPLISVGVIVSILGATVWASLRSGAPKPAPQRSALAPK